MRGIALAAMLLAAVSPGVQTPPPPIGWQRLKAGPSPIPKRSQRKRRKQQRRTR